MKINLLKLLPASRGDSLDRFYLLKAFGFGLFLHRIHSSDPQNVFHSHPWNGISLIFGSYDEEYYDEPGTIFHRKWFNSIKATRYHRTIVTKPCLTLFFHFRKCNQWSVLDSGGNQSVTPWDGKEGHKSYSEALATEG